jgi:hypothetical protein
MNLYLIVEGIGDKRIYETWIPLLNPVMRKVNLISEISQNCFFIISGNGYPNYLEIIENGIDTINSLNVFDRLIISVDSEDFTREEKYIEIDSFIEQKRCSVPVYLVIQHFCIETWLLGNAKIGPRNPKGPELKRYKSIFNILTNDPELLPSLPEDEYNRSQFALQYLKTCLRDRKKNLSYRKSDPIAACHPTYLSEVKRRTLATGHISSFEGLLNALI